MLMTRMFSLRSGNLRPQATDAAHDQVDLHAGAGSFVEFLDDLLVDERVELHDHARRLCRRAAWSRSRSIMPMTRLLQIEGRDQQFFQARITGEAGERVENDRDFLGDFRVGREQG